MEQETFKQIKETPIEVITTRVISFEIFNYFSDAKF